MFAHTILKIFVSVTRNKKNVKKSVTLSIYFIFFYLYFFFFSVLPIVGVKKSFAQLESILLSGMSLMLALLYLRDFFESHTKLIITCEI